MKKFQPIFLENLEISIPGFSILRFAHHRHSERSDQIEQHEHRHSQFLLYLRGKGVQTLKNETLSVIRGSFLYFPSRTVHGFVKSMSTSPLSLVIDFKENGKRMSKARFKNLNPTNLSEIENSLHRLIRSADLQKTGSPKTAAEILAVFSLLHQCLGDKESTDPNIHPVTCKVRRLLADLPKIVSSPRKVADLMGEDLSSLNRKIRNESGLNLGTLLDDKRLEIAYADLKKENVSISQIAWDCGFQDPNYFARWFRKKVGQTPRQWQAGTVTP